MLSVGIDLVSVRRFSFIETAGGAAFYRHVFTPAEQQACGYSLILLAACFAAKEAVSKVLGTGLTIGSVDRVTCHSMEISDIETSEPKVQLGGVALQVAKRLELDRIALRRDNIGDTLVVSAIGAAGISTIELQQELKIIQAALVGRPGIKERKLHCNTPNILDPYWK